MHSDLHVKFSGVRSLERWRCSTFTHADVNAFAGADELAKGIHTIFEGGHPIDLHVDIKPGQPLVIVFNGAVARSDVLKLPVFSGFGVVPASVSRVCVSDPSLYLSPTLTLGWYAGSSGLPLQALMLRILDVLMKRARAAKVMFVGGSGGGFASLYYSRLIPEALALVWNPQTDILRYTVAAVTSYAQAAFGLADIVASKAELPERIETNLCSLYGQKQRNRVIYLQNESDWHVRSHCRPFLIALGHDVGTEILSRQLSDRLYFHVGRWGEGHAAPANSFLKSVLANLLASPAPWVDLYAEGALVSQLHEADLKSNEVAPEFRSA